jgi:prepilin-type processing-associated H-X9-DG protein
MNGFENCTRVYPPSWRASADGLSDGWSIQARLLPFLEEQAIEGKISYDKSYVNAADYGGQKISALRIGPYLCPSEEHDVVRLNGAVPEHYPLNYGMNFGVWFIWDPVTKTGGAAPFHPHSKIRERDIRDGLSKTLCAAEVKGWTGYQRDGGGATDAIPSSPSDIPTGGQMKWGPGYTDNTGHTEWVDGRAHQTGFTTTFRPNEVVSPGHAGGRDIDFTSSREGKSNTQKTYAAITARSHHTGGIVNVVFLDGSSRAVSSEVDLQVWRAASTRNGGEAAGELE